MVDPMENGLFDIPDYDNTDDETFPPLPPPFSPGEGGDPFTGEEGGEISKLAEVPVAKRRGVKRPQPKLDSQRLTSERGLPALRNLFDNVHFKGKGHEAEDLRVLMQRMENWAHRLYPKLQFEDFIDKLETLGSKKEVQTCLKRIRLDMPLTHEDFIGDDGEDDTAASRDGRVVNHDDPDPFGDGGFAEDPPGRVPSTPAPSLFPSSQAGPVHSTPAPSLTEEQQRRIELNKRLALERRLARMQQHTDGSQEMASSQSADRPSTSQSQEMATQSADGHSTRSSSHPFPSQQQQDGEDEDLYQGDPEDKGQSRPDHSRDRALNTAPPAEADSLVCEGAVASPVPEMSNDSRA